MSDRTTGSAGRAQTRGIPTTCGGLNYRSSTEARWAKFFDLIGWDAQYEALDLDGYIPDFVMPFAHGPLLVEIKAELYVNSLLPAADKIDESGWKYDALVLGATPFLTSDSGPAFGYLRDAWSERYEDGVSVRMKAWGPADPTRCRLCQTLGVCSSIHSYENRMCGHYDGDTYRGEWSEEEIRATWTIAANSAQWSPR